MRCLWDPFTDLAHYIFHVSILYHTHCLLLFWTALIPVPVVRLLHTSNSSALITGHIPAPVFCTTHFPVWVLWFLDTFQLQCSVLHTFQFECSSSVLYYTLSSLSAVITRHIPVFCTTCFSVWVLWLLDTIQLQCFVLHTFQFECSDY